MDLQVILQAVQHELQDRKYNVRTRIDDDVIELIVDFNNAPYLIGIQNDTFSVGLYLEDDDFVDYSIELELNRLNDPTFDLIDWIAASLRELDSFT